MENFRKIIASSVITLIFTFLSNFAYAAPNASEAQINKFIQYTVKKYKFSPSYIHSVLRQAQFNREIITKMEHPYEALPWYKYEELFVTPERVQQGIDYWNRSNKLVTWEEKEYHVPGSIILAIIGIESKYGRNMGSFRVLDTLATLAFSYPPREEFFQHELAAFIAMTKTYKLNPTAILGSYAGAMGQCQFMPSSYLYFAVDFHGKGAPNLFSDKADVIFSVGNYLKQNGWEDEGPIAVPAKITGSYYHKILKQNPYHLFEPILTLTQLAQYGIVPAYGHFNPSLKANLIKLEGSQGPEYWLTFHNFYVITSYNASDLYAMAAFQLAQKLQHAWDEKQNL